MALFVHAADIHLDSPLKGLFPYESAPDIEEIRGATRHALDNLVRLVLSEKACLLIIAGDLYDGDWPDFNTGLHFARQMQRLGEAGVWVAVVRGNHDAANTMTRTLIMPENVKIFKDRRPETWILKEVGIAVHGQSYSTPAVTENLALTYPDPVEGLLNVGVLHCLISGTKGHMPYAPCTLDQLAAKGYDYWALGHVHEYGVLKEKPLIVYPGCIQGRHIRETGEKGCVLVDNDSGTLKEEFVSLDLLRWMKITVDISGAENIQQVTERFSNQLAEEMGSLDNRICCARVFLKGRCSVHGRLHTDPATVSANIRAVAADVSHRRTWIEKVELNTSPELDPKSLAGSDTPQGELLRYIQELFSNSQLYQELGLDFSQLKSKLAGSGLVVPDKDLRGMLSNARDILLTMLSDDMEDGGSGSNK